MKKMFKPAKHTSRSFLQKLVTSFSRWTRRENFCQIPIQPTLVLGLLVTKPLLRSSYLLLKEKLLSWKSMRISTPTKFKLEVRCFSFQSVSAESKSAMLLGETIRKLQLHIMTKSTSIDRPNNSAFTQTLNPTGNKRDGSSSGPDSTQTLLAIENLENKRTKATTSDIFK